LEDKGKRLDALRKHLATGAGQAANGGFMADFNIENIIALAKIPL
jgi:hypothetical protein